MKKYIKEIIILLLQLLLFYAFPLSAGPTDAMGMVVLIIFGTFILSVLMDMLSKSKIKYLYPVVTALVFLPSVFIYYNETALIHAVWYLVVCSAGFLLVELLNLMFFLAGKLFKKK